MGFVNVILNVGNCKAESGRGELPFGYIECAVESRIVGFGKRKARNFGVCALLLFVLLPKPPCGRGPPCGREQSCRVRGCGQLPVLTAVADCLWLTAWANLPGPTCRTRLRAGPDAAGAVSRTCTGRRARWLGILPFRVCRRGLRCCGFSPLRGARILSCLSQGT